MLSFSNTTGLSKTAKAVFIVILMAVCSVFAVNAALASGPGDEGGAISHYEVEVPKTADEAETMLRNAILKVKSALAASQWNEIHEASYSLEAATKRIGEELGEDGEEEVEHLADRIEIMHLASELEDEATIKAATPAMLENAEMVLEKLDGR